MHHEVGISACLKNMMGCLVGQENKKKTHYNLARNIVHLNRYLNPHLHIVDALIAMEGNGPSDGIPIRLDTIIAGTDPYFLDMVCAELVGMHFREVPYLRVAEEWGLISAEHTAALDNLDLAKFKRDLLKPHVPLLLRIACNPHLQKYFQMLRHAPGLYELCNTKFMGDVFLRLGIRQEHFIREDLHIEGMVIHRDTCPPGCTKCKDYCPLGLDVPEILSDGDESACIKCLYCYMVCPKEAIQLEGNLGFLKAQIDKYDPLIRRIV
jgi:NAD-dependent dihydropyrimidine dehydrogenase PreA subunit